MGTFISAEVYVLTLVIYFRFTAVFYYSDDVETQTSS